MHIMYIETFRTAVIVSMDNVIMCLMSYWPIIFSIRISSLILIISLGGMKWFFFISVTHEDETILLFYAKLICTLVRYLILLSLNYHKLQNCRYSIFPIIKYMDVVEWSRGLDVRLSEWCCSVSMVWVQIPSREEQKFDSSKI